MDEGELISIVMTCFEQPEQLRNTLDSFRFHGCGPEVEVVVVDDGSIIYRADADIPTSTFELRIIYLPCGGKWYSNPCIPFNLGFKAANGELVFIQNAECFHHDIIVRHARANVGADNYLAYACQSQTTEDF
jgi:hypothetical protein